MYMEKLSLTLYYKLSFNVGEAGRGGRGEELGVARVTGVGGHKQEHNKVYHHHLI